LDELKGWGAAEKGQRRPETIKKVKVKVEVKQRIRKDIRP
jgi:hypothetical protein